MDGKKNWIDWNLKAKEKALTQTLNETLQLFLQKKSPEEISKIRDYKLDTIQRQIIELITMSFINIEDVVEKNRFKKIENLIEKKQIIKLSEIKENLSEDISYFEIKATIASINSIAKKIN